MYMKHPEGIENGVIRLSDKAWIPSNMENTDWQGFQLWLEEDPSNQPLAWDEAVYSS